MSRSQQDLLRAYGIKPVKRRGQNFLLDGNLARAIAHEALALGDDVLELGAGGGALTAHLLDGGARVAAVEIDRRLCALLADEFGGRPGFRLIEGDLAKLDWSAALAAAGTRPVVTGNLPYVLTSTILFALAERRDDVAGGVFMIQKEVAERMVAASGGREYGVMTVLLQALFEIKLVRAVPATVFWPRPEVASAVVRLLRRDASGAPWAEGEFMRFADVVKKLFGQRRKQLVTQLRAHFGLSAEQATASAVAAGLAPGCRPEDIDVAGYRRLADLLAGEDGA